MPFSRLLLIAANSKKCIRGEGDDKICISRKSSRRSDMDPYEGEVILCFQLDDKTDEGKRTALSIGIFEGEKRCDGLVFYSQDDSKETVICLVEMKRTNIAEAARQILSTRKHITELLLKECQLLPGKCSFDIKKQVDHIIWKACLFHYGASQEDIKDFQKELAKEGFDAIGHLDRAKNDLRPLLTGEGRSAKEMKKSLPGGREENRGKKR